MVSVERRVYFDTTCESKNEEDIITEIDTKTHDGPNNESYMIGKLISDFILNNKDYEIFIDLAVNNINKSQSILLVDMLKNRIYEIEEFIKENDSYCLFYKDYKIKKSHLEKLEKLSKILQIHSIDLRYQCLCQLGL